MDDAGDIKPWINPGEVRCIALGAGGAWVGGSLDGDRVDWRILPNPHDLARALDWAGAKQFYIDQNVAPPTGQGACASFTICMRSAQKIFGSHLHEATHGGLC